MQITQDTLHNRPMSCSRGMQELTYFVDRKRDIQPSKGEVLERSNHTAIIYSIIRCQRITIRERDKFSLAGSGVRMALQSCMPNRRKMSLVYFSCVKTIPSELGLTSILKK
jgi:hypothetical protein